MEDKKKIVVPQKKPYIVELEKEKTYKWCTCGRSANQPFCDGSHRITEGNFRPQPFVVNDTKKYALCGCKHSNNKPFCDGTHRSV